MKKLLLIVSISFFGNIYAQNVGINSTGSTPAASAGLDVDFSNKGILIPRVTLTNNTDVTTIPSPVVSLMVYHNGSPGLLTAGFYYWNGSQWVNFGAQGATGPQGPAGPAGATGPQGPQGPSGGSVTYTQRVSFTTAGQTTWDVPAGVSSVKVHLVGGGGGGHDNNSQRSSGGSGGYVVGEMAVTPGQTLYINVGSGGTGRTNTSDATGGTGSYIKTGSHSGTWIAGGGGGGGGRRTSSGDGNGGGQAFGTSINGGNGSTGSGGASGNNYIAGLSNVTAYFGKATRNSQGDFPGVFGNDFTILYNSTSRGLGGDQFGGNGQSGIVVIEYY